MKLGEDSKNYGLLSTNIFFKFINQTFLHVKNIEKYDLTLPKKRTISFGKKKMSNYSSYKLVFDTQNLKANVFTTISL